MARHIDSATIQLIVNGSQPAQKIKELTKYGEDLRKKLSEATKIGDLKEMARLRKEIAKNDAELKNMLSSTQRIENAMRQLDKATPKDLKNTIKEINRQLNSGDVERGSEQWKRLTEALRTAKAELNEVKAEQKAAVDTFSNKGDSIAKWGNKLLGAYTIAKDGISALYSSMQSYVADYAEMAEHMANVTKYTGLAADDVEELNEAFKNMDTRTSREALNDLAADAGRLGIQSKQEVLDFVEAADQINVALGEDLGEDAVKNIGKLAQMFGDADSMGLKKAMLATGSTINELAQSSSAAEGYLMDFTQRLAGVGKQAGMTQAQIMGLGSVLDQNSVQAEVAATALSKILQKLYQDPAQMAKAAGLDVQQFTNLLKTDANAALIQFARGMNNLGGMEGMAPVLKDLSITGDGVSRTLMTIAQNTEQVTATQQQATQAFQDATSVTAEFNAQNNTVQAQLEKQQKRFHDLSVELGANLFPVLNAVTSVFNTLINVLRTVFSFIGDHLITISTLTALILLNTTAVKASTLATTLHTLATKASAVATKAWAAAVVVARAAALPFRAAIGLLHVAMVRFTSGAGAARIAMGRLTLALKANPWIALATVIVGVVVAAFSALKKSIDSARAAQRALNDIRTEASRKVDEQKQKIEELIAVANDETRSMEERRRATEAINKIVPEMNAQIDATTRKLRYSKTALDNYINSLIQLYEVEGAKEQLKKIGEERAKYQAEKDQAEAEAREIQEQIDRAGSGNSYTTQAYGTAGATMQNYVGVSKTSLSEVISRQRTVNNAEKKLKELQKKEDAIRKRYGKEIATSTLKETEKDFEDAAGGFSGSGGGNGSGGNSTPTKQLTPEEKAALKEREDALTAYYNKQRIEQELAARIGTQTTEQKRQNILRIEEEELTAKRDLYDRETSEWSSWNEKLLSLRQTQAEEQKNWSIADLNRQEQEELAAAERRHYVELTSEEDFERDKEAITLKYLTRRADFYKETGDYENYNKTIAELDKAAQDQQLARLKKFYEDIKKLREQEVDAANISTQYQEEVAVLDQALNDKLISNEEYWKKKMAIDAKYLAAQLSPDGKDNKGDGKTDGKGESEEGQTYELKIVANSDPFSSALVNCFNAFDALNDKIKKDGKASWQDYAAAGEAALQVVMAGMSAFSSYYQAQQQLEEAQVTAKYDAEIEKAGSSTTKGKKLEEKKQKELAAIKTKYNKKQQAMEIAQAVASTAMAAINAFASASKEHWLLGAVAAAAAMAYGAMQIATIKKQHEAEAAGYYEGGYTGNVGERKVAGVVHGGEFVMNARAVSNPALAPVLSLIDHAQRNNTVASLTPEQVSAAVVAPQRTARATLLTADSAALAAEQTAALQSAQSSLAVVTSQASAEQAAVSRDTATQLRRLADQLDTGITAIAAIDGTNGIANQLRRYNRMKSH